MKKILFVAFIALTATCSITAQSTDHPRGKAAYENLTLEQKAKVQEMKAKIEAMTPEERKAYFAKNGGRQSGRPNRG